MKLVSQKLHLLLEFKNTIEEFELYSYKYGSWEITIDELNLPEFEANEIV